MAVYILFLLLIPSIILKILHAFLIVLILPAEDVLIMLRHDSNELSWRILVGFALEILVNVI